MLRFQARQHHLVRGQLQLHRCFPPGEGALRGCRLSLLREAAQKLYERLVCFAVLGIESGDNISEVVLSERRLLVDLARQESLAKRAKRNKSDAEFLQGR